MVKYQELWNEENTNITERYDLAMERILEIPAENRVAEPYRAYFNQMAAFTAKSRNWQECSFARISTA
ncbi:hypothetical protein [Clostridium sp. OF09-36]|uniref:hypothetical protein n=1 Tax=Clostridium sp. OF09-36 TaxID=2292310 RepID=UPI00325A539C